MLNTKSIFAALLVLGTSTAALAAPCNDPPVAAQPFAQQPVVAATVIARPKFWHGPVMQPRTVELASDTRVTHDVADTIWVGTRAGAFRTLTLQGDAGRTWITRVQVNFADGHSEQIPNINREFDRGTSLTKKISSYPQPIASVQVFGRELGARGGVNVLATT